MAAPKNYRTYQDFEREEIRPSFKVGFSMEDMVEEATFETDTFDWDKDPFEVDDELDGSSDYGLQAAGYRLQPDGEQSVRAPLNPTISTLIF
jgi:hypothetical protein